mmetsp:Transcript_12891/g.24208  ORF Transcript_12891/g.24208 Transcript_12891/m.24208 type:complete len:754 (-) Transcript_12891:120-2381(-)
MRSISTRIPSLFLALVTFNNNGVSRLFISAFTPTLARGLRYHTNTRNFYTTVRNFPLILPLLTDKVRSESILLASESGENINGEGFQTEKSSSSERKPVTGWNHNLPRKNSQFWSGKKEDLSGSVKSTDPSEGSSGEKKIKTGWLHNKKKASAINKSGKENKTDTGNKARMLLEQAMMDQKVNHRMISPPTFHAVGDGRRAVITEHIISVPLDRFNPPTDPKDKEPMVDIYFSIVELVTTPAQESFFRSLQAISSGANNQVRQREAKKRAADYKAFAKLKNAEECVLYLQGGPGFGAPIPINGIGLGEQSSWIGAALSKGYKRIILMDQRGTGRSSTITKQTLQKRFPDLFLLDEHTDSVVKEGVTTQKSIETEIESLVDSRRSEVEKVKKALHEATEFMTHFRADNIVKDAEAIKDALLLVSEESTNDKSLPSKPWGLALGQSFGGFCMMSYLSLIPHPPLICLLTGGVAPMLTHVDDVYAALRERVKERNMKYYERYPGDVDIVKRIVSSLEKAPQILPSGGILTARRFLQVGIGLGGSPSSFATLHSLFSTAFVSDDDDDFTKAFLKEMDNIQPFDDHPFYYLLHESIYADNTSDCKQTSWSAHRVYEHDKDFQYYSKLDKAEPVLLTGEVIFPWMSDGDYAELSGFGMRALAHAIAEKNDWRPLYNSENMRKALAVDGTCTSKAAAALYYDDMYVDFDFAMKVAKRGGPLENCRVWVSNEYQHSGLRDDGSSIFNKLLGMAKGEIGIPS